MPSSNGAALEPSSCRGAPTRSTIPALRGRGLGGLLLDAVDAELERRGIPDSVIGVLPQNAAAVRLYERRGYRPAWLVLTRFRSPQA